MERIFEPEVMDSPQEATEYDQMDFTAVNTAFAEEAIALYPHPATVAKVLDAGTGTARIPILIAQKCPHWQMIAIDLAESMLHLGRKNVADAGLSSRIQLELVDSKQLPYADGSFEGVISNSLVHHLPDPLPFFREIKRVLKPQGFLLLRDLLRPETPEIAQQMVDAIGPDYDDHQRQLFYDSLCAAFTLEEVQELLQQSGWQNVRVYQSSDRHWTASHSPRLTP